MTSAALPQPPATAHVVVFRAANPHYVATFVEGPDDVDLWSPWLKWRPLPMGGCLPVLAAIDSLRQAQMDGYVGVIDANCHRLEGTDHRSENVIVTEGHDIECDTLRLSALDKLLSTVNEVALETLIGARPVREAILDRALPFGLLRWHFFRRRIEYPGGRLSPNNFIDPATLTVDEPRLMAEAASALGCPLADLAAEVTSLRSKGASSWDVCNGHDVVAVLTLGLQALGGRGKYPQKTVVATAMRLAIDSSELGKLLVWRKLKEWELNHPPFVVCKG